MTDQVLVEMSLIGWKEYELEVMRDTSDNCVIVCSIENVDPMGVHTGDSITVAPVQTLTDREYQRLRDASIAIIREMGVECGGSNVQLAVNPDDGACGGCGVVLWCGGRGGSVCVWGVLGGRKKTHDTQNPPQQTHTPQTKQNKTKLNKKPL
jgi:hypothetical protein